MENKKWVCWTLFRTTFSLSAFTFGGGYVMIPLMRQRFVERLRWISEEEMLDLAAIAQSAPGSMSINASILLGYRVAGIRGALTAILGTVLPPLLTLTAISFFYRAFRQNAVVHAVLRGMQAGVVAVVTDAVLNLGAAVLQEKNALRILVMALAFGTAFFLKINVAYIILACGCIGAAQELIKQRRGNKRVLQAEHSGIQTAPEPAESEPPVAVQSEAPERNGEEERE